ncbi:fibronectin type III domain-containing protein [Cellvibrio sp. PSBB023]|uniref:fibronectin type III domain-containing protein n=1 Tax=Cellvibrio sp. PSBB023 TaxID=1945512 RepID=UPI00098EC680|nr:fibronectin type III domain-containing protein [Cellvibrio sp. PSBB023]AQT61270.1 hypothetical protein B0D95_15025 [Cellvibrio sp. PSBB023]
MKKLSLISTAFLGSALVACGGGSGSPSKTDLCSEVGATNCNQVVIPSSTSSSSSSLAPPVNNLLPFTEKFAVDNATALFSASYKSLLNPGDDLTPSFYYSTSGLDAGRMVAANGKMTIGNARMTIGQRLQTTGTHINPEALPADFKVNTTTDGTAANFPTTTTWGELDLTHPWKISFCVNEFEALSGSASNQQFMVYVDNNQSTSSFSLHGTKSLVKQLNVTNFVAGKRVEINFPGDVFVDGKSIDSVLQNPGTTSSFIQLRVPSAGVVTMSELWVGYQSDKTSEPTAATCAASARVPGWNIAPPPEVPAAPTFEPNNNQLKVNWAAAARATSYTVAYNTVDSLEGAIIIGDDDSNGVGEITTTTTTITGLTNLTSYYVFVKAHNAGGSSAYGPSAIGIPDVPKTPPAAPTGLKTYSDDRRALVTWEASAGAESYSVAVGTSNDPATATVTDGIIDTNYRVKNLVNNTPYYVFVRGANVIGNGDYSPAQAVTPAVFDVYQANFAVTLEQFFDSTSATTSLAFPTTPAVQTLSLENDQAMALTLAGESRMAFTEAGLRVGNARFAIGLEGVKQENGTYTYTATAKDAAPVGGTLDLTNNYQICYTVVEKHTDGLFRVYVDNTSTTSGNSIHGTKSRLINQDIVNIPLNTEQCVDFIDDAHVGTANSFIQVGTDGNATAVGVVLSSFKIVDLNTTPIKTESSSSSSVASSVASSSSVVASSSSEAASSSSSSEASSSSSVEVSSSSSSSSSEASSSSSEASSSSSSAPSGGTDVNTVWASFDPNTYISILSNSVASTTNNAVIQSSTAHSVNGLNFFHSATGTLRHRGGSNLEWNFNGTGFASGDPVAAVGAAAEEMRAYIGVPVDAGRAVTITVVHRNSTSAGTALGSIVFVGSDENVLAKYDAKVGTATTTTFSLPAGHTQTEVKFLFSREGGGAGGMHVTSIDKTYN